MSRVIVLLCIAVFAIVYVLFAFCIWDLDCSNWNESSRIAMVWISVLISAFFVGAFVLYKADKKS